MKVTMIAALDEGRLIGTGSGLPWNLPRDRRHFREMASGKAMLLGRRTFEEMAGWFSDQRPIVLTRQANYRPPAGLPTGIIIASSIGAALDAARSRGESGLLVAGGGQIYGLALPFADELILTEVAADLAGEVYFPKFSLQDWEEISREHFEADADNRHAMNIVVYRRR